MYRTCANAYLARLHDTCDQSDFVSYVDYDSDPANEICSSSAYAYPGVRVS